MKRTKLDKEKYKMYSLKRSTRKCFVGAKSSVHGDKNFEEKLDTKYNKGSGDLRARSHPVKIPTGKDELRRR